MDGVTDRKFMKIKIYCDEEKVEFLDENDKKIPETSESPSRAHHQLWAITWTHNSPGCVYVWTPAGYRRKCS